MAPTNNPDRLDQLDQKTLGDKKLSKQEMTYLKNKEHLWFPDIQGKLLTDICGANNLAWDKGAAKELDTFMQHPENITPFLKKENGITLFTDALNKAPTVNEKRAVVLNFLLSSITKDFQKTYILTDGFNYDTIKLIFNFQKEHNLSKDCVFGKSAMALLMQQIDQTGKKLSKEMKNTTTTGPLATKDGAQINITETTPFHECAEYVIDSMMKVFNREKKNTFSNMTGVVGNAWTMYENVTGRFGKSLYTAFNDQPVPADILGDAQKIKEYIEETSSDTLADFKVNRLKKGDVIGLYYPNSTNHIKAAEGCKSGTCNTHVGYVRDIMADGTPIISHNVHGTVFNQPASDLLSTKNLSTCMITWAARPNKLISI